MFIYSKGRLAVQGRYVYFTSFLQKKRMRIIWSPETG